MLTLLSGLTYVGSHAASLQTRDDVSVDFRSAGLSASSSDGILVERHWVRVISLTAVPHTPSSSQMIVTDASGTWIFIVPTMSFEQLDSALSLVRSKYLEHPAGSMMHASTADGDAVIERLRHLDELLEIGAITVDQHRRRRTEVLDSL
jgi:hypothetical protein